MSFNVNDFTRSVYAFMDSGRYDEAKRIVIEKLDDIQPAGEGNIMLLAEIAGFLIDIGSEHMDAEAAEKGVSILENNRQLFEGKLNAASYYYNLGNGKEALYKVRKYGPGLPSPAHITPELIDAKNCLYKAYKAVSSANQILEHKINSNLGGNLGQAGRVIDAIKFYQTILKVNPEFPQALLGLAENLDYWALTANYGFTDALNYVIYQYYKLGIEKANLPPKYIPRIIQTFRHYQNRLTELGYDQKRIETEFFESGKEYEQHTPYRKFCLDHYLSLNEHAIYCYCRKATFDDFAIGREQAVFSNPKVPKLELLVNRLKVEFGLARQLYYDSLQPYSDDIIYYDLSDNESIGINTEKLRASFKACFSIFDKIAHGICYFYELRDKPDENIYFDRFFLKPTRWEKIKGIKNCYLTALFSIASDLNKKEGEFGFYKEWRNILEHNLLVLTNDSETPDVFNIFSEPGFVHKVPREYFKKQALHLLQLCRSAIFSFVYCIRLETIENPREDSQHSIIINPKRRDE